MAPVPFTGGLFSRFVSWIFRWGKQPQNPAHALGRAGEQLAARYLRRHGYRVLYRNFRSTRGGEVDLVCRDVALKTLVFVEVKTRSSDAFARPADAVDAAKRRLLIRGATAWLRLLDDPTIVYRFDIVEVLIRSKRDIQISIVKDAFQSSTPLSS